jgi:hypothetical protein
MLSGGGGGGGAEGGSRSELVAVVVEGVEMYRENYVVLVVDYSPNMRSTTFQLSGARSNQSQKRDMINCLNPSPDIDQIAKALQEERQPTK